jgi:hypothetical protein
LRLGVCLIRIAWMGFAESAELLGLFAIDPARFIHESVRSEPVEEPCFDRLSTNGAHVLFRFKSCRSNKAAAT